MYKFKLHSIEDSYSLSGMELPTRNMVANIFIFLDWVVQPLFTHEKLFILAQQFL